IVKIHFKSTGDIPSLSNPTTISGEIELDLNNLFIIESEDEENLCKSNKITCRDDEGALIIEVDKTNSFNPDNFKDLLAK
ncbi:hypothetical protein, partial [Pseudoalteromonas sp. SIMBA_162]|uniref:hypothetical protein n=1 Tax=Pseudoalteromonas sp. SIMBA_162 TaxID=3080867 RepID=UPI00397C1841